MSDKLTPSDQGDLRKVADRFAAKLFREPEASEFVRDGKVAMTQPMLAELIEEVLRLGFDIGRGQS